DPVHVPVRHPGEARPPAYLERVRGPLVAEAAPGRAARGPGGAGGGGAAGGRTAGGGMSAPRSRITPLGAGRPTVEVLDDGDGAPLLFLHGAGGIPAWDGALPLLAREYHVYAPLLPGFGRSTGLEHLEDQLDLVLHCFDVMEALGLWRDEAPVADMFGMMPHELVPYLFHDQSCPAAQALQAVTTLFSEKDDRTQEQVEFLISLVRGFRSAAKFLFPIPEHGLEKRLPRIKTPTLVVWGTEDRFVQPLYPRIFGEKIPGARVQMI